MELGKSSPWSPSDQVATSAVGLFGERSPVFPRPPRDRALQDAGEPVVLLLCLDERLLQSLGTCSVGWSRPSSTESPSGPTSSRPAQSPDRLRTQASAGRSDAR